MFNENFERMTSDWQCGVHVCYGLFGAIAFDPVFDIIANKCYAHNPMCTLLCMHAARWQFMLERFVADKHFDGGASVKKRSRYDTIPKIGHCMVQGGKRNSKLR